MASAPPRLAPLAVVAALAAAAHGCGDEEPSLVARVETLFPVGGRVALRSVQLRPGTPVVTEGHQRLSPGQPLASINGGGS